MDENTLAQSLFGKRLGRPGLLLALCMVCAFPAHSGSAEKKRERLDLFGDPFPAGAVARLGTIRFRHPGEIASIAFSPDGKLIASASDEAVCYWDAASGRRIRCFRQDGFRFQAVAFSIEGNVLTVGCGGLGAPILLWDARTGKEIRRLKEAHTSGSSSALRSLQTAIC